MRKTCLALRIKSTIDDKIACRFLRLKHICIALFTDKLKNILCIYPHFANQRSLVRCLTSKFIWGSPTRPNESSCAWQWQWHIKTISSLIDIYR